MAEIGITFEKWEEIRVTFLRYGFTNREAKWAANNNLDPEGPRRIDIRKLLRNRRLKLRTLVQYTGLPRREVIKDLEEESRFIAREKGEDENNLFMGAT